MSVKLTTNMEDESPTLHTSSEGKVCVPKPEKEKDAIPILQPNIQQ